MRGYEHMMVPTFASWTAAFAAGRWISRCVRSSTMTLTSTRAPSRRSEEHTSELQSLMRISYAVFCLKKKKNAQTDNMYKYNTHNNTYSHRTILMRSNSTNIKTNT